ncbi:terminase [Mesorhizobium sp. B2-3-4]|uniref:terminase small subunit-like protein n=1 Tax=Mesorhizobium sp. B2-3-4 TaxID=2589959 RepID=UPI001129277E|nr:terminase [Mesorhizobium sp. B2-3-4]TPM39596.1 terminase [Mesorhizobium sp. B2-3-4]
MAKPTIRTPKKEAAFFDTLRDGQSVTAACINAGISRTAAYEWRDADDEFRKMWDEAVDEGTDRLEDEAHRRARDGVQKPVYQGGKRVGEIREYSDTLTIFLLKARRPDKFKDRVSTEISAPGGGPVQVEVSARERIASRLAGLAERQGKGSGS